MSRPSSRSTLYRLIEAGQLAHKALLLPLLERGLEPGDDAILFELGRSGTTEAELAAELGLSGEALDTRLTRLFERDLVTRQAVGPELAPGVALTERGRRNASAHPAAEPARRSLPRPLGGRGLGWGHKANAEQRTVNPDPDYDSRASSRTLGT